MLTALLSFAVVGCTPLGAVVSERIERALEHPSKPTGSTKAELAQLDQRAAQLAKRPLAREDRRHSMNAALESYSQLILDYAEVLPKASPIELLTSVAALVDVTEHIEALMNTPPPDWPEETWAEYEKANGCYSRGRGLLLLGLRTAKKYDLRGPVRDRLAERLRRLDLERDDD